MNFAKVGDKGPIANKFRPNGKGLGNLPGSSNPMGCKDNSGDLKKQDKMGKIVGE